MSNKVAITGHMVVKNEDQWVYFAIKSILPFVDRLLITDTGSTDNTLAILRGIKSDKIVLNVTVASTPQQVTAVRQAQLTATKTDWFWLIDGDEVYTEETAKEIVTATTQDYSVITVRRYDLLGDVYHCQKESVGTYELYGEKGHLVSRLFNKKRLPNLQLEGDYPNENYYFGGHNSTLNLDLKDVYITKGRLWHAMYLMRSSLGKNIAMINRHKYKVELGKQIKAPLPSVFYDRRPSNIQDPLSRRGIFYTLMALFITPIKNIKRAFLHQ